MNENVTYIKNSRNLVALIVLCAVFGALSPVFLTFENIANILLASSTLGILSIGASFILGSQGIDLSVGSVMATSAVIGAVLFQTLHLPAYAVVPIALVTGALLGMTNGMIIAVTRIPAFIVTLGMLSIARGMAMITTAGQPIYGLPESVLYLGQGTFLGIAVPVWIVLVLAVIASIILNHTRFGKHIIAIGDNEEAARNAGIPIVRTKIMLYGLSGLFAAIAGIIFTCRINAADPSAGNMYELMAITAAIIGGTHMFGGYACVGGALGGALLMGILQNGFVLLAIPPYYQQIAVGCILIMVVVLNYLARNNRHVA